MKTRLLFLAILSLLAIDVNAQSMLKKIGKQVEKTVKKEVTNYLSKDKEKEKEKETPKQQQSTAPVNTQPKQQNNPVAETIALDKGENIPRDNSLDYIDEYGVNHGGGILIDGIVWAPVNCGYHQTDYPFGKLYQWGRKLGQGYGAPYRQGDEAYADKTTAAVVPAPVSVVEARKEANKNKFYAKSKYAPFNWTTNDIFLWNTNMQDEQKPIKSVENDPCPKGWRVAHDSEYSKLVKNHSKGTKHDTGQTGYWCSGSKVYSLNVPRIFLPAAGSREVDGLAGGRSRVGWYWTCHHYGGELLVGHIFFDKSNKILVDPQGHPTMGKTVRCVKETYK